MLEGPAAVQQPAPAAVGCAHALDLCTADRVEQARHFAGHEQVLASADRGDEIAAFSEFAKPRPFRRWPGSEARAAGFVRILMARLRLGSAQSPVRVSNPRSRRNASASSNDLSALSGRKRHWKLRRSRRMISDSTVPSSPEGTRAV